MTDDAPVVYASPERRPTRYVEMGFWRQSPADPGTLILGCTEDGQMVWDMERHDRWHSSHDPMTNAADTVDLYFTRQGEMLAVPIPPYEFATELEDA